MEKNCLLSGSELLLMAGNICITLPYMWKGRYIFVQYVDKQFVSRNMKQTSDDNHFQMPFP